MGQVLRLSALDFGQASKPVNIAFDARAINAAIITLKQTACRCPTVGAAAPTAAPTAIGGRRAGA